MGIASSSSSEEHAVLSMKTPEDARKYVDAQRFSPDYEERLKQSAALKENADRCFSDGRLDDAYAFYNQAAEAKDDYDKAISHGLVRTLFALSKKSTPEDGKRYMEFITNFPSWPDDIQSQLSAELGRFGYPNVDDASLQQTIDRLIAFQSYPERDQQLVTGRGPNWSATLLYLLGSILKHLSLRRDKAKVILKSMNVKLEMLFTNAPCFKWLLSNVNVSKLHTFEAKLLSTFGALLTCWGDNGGFKNVAENQDWYQPFLRRFAESVVSDEFRRRLFSSEPGGLLDGLALLGLNQLTLLIRGGRRRPPFPFDSLVWAFKALQIASYLRITGADQPPPTAKNLQTIVMLLLSENPSFRQQLTSLSPDDWSFVVGVMIELGSRCFAEHARGNFIDERYRPKKSTTSHEQSMEMFALWLQFEENARPASLLLDKGCVFQYFTNQIGFFVDNLRSLNSAGCFHLRQSLQFITSISEEAQNGSELLEWAKSDDFGPTALKLVSSNFGHKWERSLQIDCVQMAWSMVGILSTASQYFYDRFFQPVDFINRIFDDRVDFLGSGQLHCLAIALTKDNSEPFRPKFFVGNIFPDLLGYFVEVAFDDEADDDNLANCLIALNCLLKHVVDAARCLNAMDLKPLRLFTAIFLVVDKAAWAAKRNQLRNISAGLAAVIFLKNLLQKGKAIGEAYLSETMALKRKSVYKQINLIVNKKFVQ